MTWQPETKFPYVGPPGNRLYRQGLCKVCHLLLMGEEPRRRDYCWTHEQPELAGIFSPSSDLPDTAAQDPGDKPTDSSTP